VRFDGNRLVGNRQNPPNEEQRLLAAAAEQKVQSPLHDCVVAALETGMRKGEILGLQWRHVRWLQNEIALEWRNTKTRRARQIPISPTMREVLARRQKAHPKDREWTAEEYVFGNEIGERVLDIKRPPGRAPATAPRSAICIFTTCGTRRGRGSWRQVGPCTPSRAGSGTRSSRRPTPT
jgi:integrase